MPFIYKHFWKFVSLVVVILAMASLANLKNSRSNILQEETINQSKPLPSVETLTLGNWTPQGNRSVLLTIQSDAEVDIIAELSSTVDKIHVKAGDQVSKGQKLLSFSTNLDQTAINYLNAQQALSSTRLNNQASIASSRIALENAKNDLEQTQRQEDLNFQKTIETLRTQARNSQANFTQALNLMDQWLGISPQYRYAQDMSKTAVGGRDGIGKSKNQNQVRELLRTFQTLPSLPNSDALPVIFTYAQARINYARDLQEAFTLFESLVRGAVLNQAFSETSRQTLLSEISGIRASMNADLLSLNNALEEGRTSEERKKLTILNAQNRYKSAQTSYEMSQSSANSQAISAQNQLRVAQAAQNDLTIRAPFSGVVSEKMINVGAQVSPGTKLFRLTNPSFSKKGVAFLSIAEYDRLSPSSTSSEDTRLDIQINDQRIPVQPQGVSARIDSQSQKMRVEFSLSPEYEDQVLVGQIGSILLPAHGDGADLLPLSAISFEPDGAEVLIVNDDNITERKKIVVGKLRSNAIEVISGLQEGSQVLKYRNRSYAGQEVNIVN